MSRIRGWFERRKYHPQIEAYRAPKHRIAALKGHGSSGRRYKNPGERYRPEYKITSSQKELSPEGNFTEDELKRQEVVKREAMSWKARREEKEPGWRNRKDWFIEMAKRGKSGKVDVVKAAKEHYPADAVERYDWEGNPSVQAKIDIMKKDYPREDTSKAKIHGRNVWIGSGAKSRRNKVGDLAKKTLKENFTKEELKNIRNLQIEGGKRLDPRCAGQHEGISLTNKPEEHISVISLGKDHIKEGTLTHEAVHARRYATGEHTRDRDLEEKMTDLETVARLSPEGLAGRTEGYYHFIPRDEKTKFEVGLTKKLEEEDRKGLTGSIDKSMKGVEAIKRVKEYYPLSNISKAHFSPGEKLDRYFQIKQKGMKTDLHQRYKKSVDLPTIKKELIENYGKDIQAWEWRDGKRVKII